jgi:general stress protein 26
VQRNSTRRSEYEKSSDTNLSNDQARFIAAHAAQINQCADRDSTDFTAAVLKTLHTTSASSTTMKQTEFDDRTLMHRVFSQIHFAMLTTRSAAEGNLVSRPVEVLQMDEAGALWIFTSAQSRKVQDISHDPRVNLTFADIADKLFLSVSGHARILADRDKLDELWTPAQTIFFPSGREDPHLVLIKVTILNAHYWDGKESLIESAWKFGRAIVAGEASDLGTSRDLKNAAS